MWNLPGVTWNLNSFFFFLISEQTARIFRTFSEIYLVTILTSSVTVH